MPELKQGMNIDRAQLEPLARKYIWWESPTVDAESPLRVSEIGFGGLPGLCAPPMIEFRCS